MKDVLPKNIEQVNKAFTLHASSLSSSPKHEVLLFVSKSKYLLFSPHSFFHQNKYLITGKGK